jgi:hypothetical protein
LSVTTFLESVSRHPQQHELLKHVASVNITRKNHYLAFDEALEQYGVKFVKQNLASSLSDPVILNQRITAIQDERERMMMLFNEFVGNSMVSTEDRAVKQYTEALWQLVDELTHAFDHPDPTQHDLFRHAQEMNEDGYQRMFSFYGTGLTRLYNILHEEIYKTKEKTKGRRVKDLVNVSAKQYLLSIKD